MITWIKNLFTTPTEAAKAALDVNKDGQVNAADAVAAVVKVEEVAVEEVKKVARKAGNAVKGKAKGKKA